MPFGSLWIQVIVSAIAVFVGSSIIHMALKYHRADYKAMTAEDSVREALNKTGAGPGVYFIPYCGDMKKMKEPAMIEKYEKGPVALLTMYPKGAPALPKLLGALVRVQRFRELHRGLRCPAYSPAGSRRAARDADHRLRRVRRLRTVARERFDLEGAALVQHGAGPDRQRDLCPADGTHVPSALARCLKGPGGRRSGTGTSAPGIPASRNPGTGILADPTHRLDGNAGVG